ncbi:MAG: M28 family peptidase [Eubacteriales bacterium]|nr:M28 family peptidase [Eubacteriales bacterium]
MLEKPMDVLTAFPVRKTKRQKQAFREAVQSFAEQLGYPCSVESGSFGSRNLIIGNPERADYLVTAHYDTCARLPIPNFLTPCNLWSFLLFNFLLWLIIVAISICVGVAVALLWDSPWGNLAAVAAAVLFLILMLLGPANPGNANDNTSGVVTLLEIAKSMPENQRRKVCFVLFDLEEARLIGSASYRKAHKTQTDRQMVLNLDCVGDGDHLILFPTKKLKKDRKRLTSLYKACGYFGKKSILLHEKGFAFYPSDQANFPYGVGVCALKKRGKTLYLDRIHTKKDTILDRTNVNLLRAALITYICRDAAQ